MGNLLTSLLSSSSALGVYGKVFDTIQNNITNANTPGYVEQDQSLISLPFDTASGLSGGITAGPVISSRSEYLEQQVRDQQGLLGSAQQKANDLNQVQALFDPTATSGVAGDLNSFFNSFSQLSVNPNDPVERQAVIDAAGQVAQSFNATANGVAQVSSNIDHQTTDAVATINQIGGELAGLNQQFLTTPDASQNAGLDAQVHAALESLSQIANFTVIRMSDGTSSVYLGGQTPLVLANHQFTVSADMSAPNTVIRDVSNAQQDQTAQQNLLTQAQAQRTSQTGVSLNAEAAKLLQFQQSYQAVGKLVSVIDSLTQTLMNIIPN